MLTEIKETKRRNTKGLNKEGGAEAKEDQDRQLLSRNASLEGYSFLFGVFLRSLEEIGYPTLSLPAYGYMWNEMNE